MGLLGDPDSFQQLNCVCVFHLIYAISVIRIKAAVGTSYNAALFTNLRSRMTTKLNALLTKTSEDFGPNSKEILSQIGRDLKMINGSGNGGKKRNSVVVKKLGELLEDLLVECEEQGQVANAVKGDAGSDGDF